MAVFLLHMLLAVTRMLRILFSLDLWVYHFQIPLGIYQKQPNPNLVYIVSLVFDNSFQFVFRAPGICMYGSLLFRGRLF